MAIGIFKSLIFGDVNSADYGIYITGEAVYNAPERAVEMVTVPGRNGAIALDQGRWENIEVSYPAGCFGGDQSDFASKISEFRNAIVSQIGYQRLTDEYNPNEYRMAVYAEGLDVKPKSKGRAGEFTITFDCKPQRYLTSGETEITVESGDILTNPTQYASSPLLAVKGYGMIGLNGYEVKLEDAPMGDVEVRPGVTDSESRGEIPDYVIQSVNTGDTITIASSYVSYFIATTSASPSNTIRTKSIVSITGDLGSSASVSGGFVRVSVPSATMTYGTYQTLTDTITIDVTLGNEAIERYSFSVRYAYFSSGVPLKVYLTLNTQNGSSTHGYVTGFPYSSQTTWGTITADSTVSILGNPTYIDCDLGECYKIENDVPISLNKYIDLGSDLPELASGSNAITYDNTVTELKVTPRWWKL